MHATFNEINIWLAPNEHQYSISMLIVRMIEISIPHLLKLNFLQQMCVSFSHVQCLTNDVLFLHLHESSCPHDGSQAPTTGVVSDPCTSSDPVAGSFNFDVVFITLI